MTEEIDSTREETEEERLELQRKIELLEQARINLRVTPFVFDRLQRQAEFLGLTIEEHCTKILEDSLTQMIGKPVISSPSKFGTTPASEKKITAPTYQVTRG